ncbi:unnamed protein product [Darwinula stevensoni]|uniref:Glycosyl hydrolase-like 10 domain-containing protein n=1 Tax=Darwinula stevensoni TaxID=69355 RepID=A0A7R8XFB7_9CRUS|nr:unnamed protein product [Darwinula stevensoni]CAG0890542.1 unnamed protein product [Darwinula stevensoni]
MVIRVFDYAHRVSVVIHRWKTNMKTMLLLWMLFVGTALGQMMEFRGAWVATVQNIDWPSQPGLDSSVAQSELIDILDLMVDLNMNAVFFQVRPHGDAMYESDLEPWSSYLTGTAGEAPSPFWDPLDFFVNAAHSRGIEVHAWLNPYRGNMRSSTNDLPDDHPCVVYNEFCYPYGNYMWMDPGAAVVADQTYNVVIDITTRYDVDGIHFDDYFYPYPVDGVPFPDDETYDDYLSGGGQMGLADWRRDNVNRLMQRCYNGIKAVKPNVKFTLSPFGIYRPCEENGMPCDIVGFDPYDGLYADALWWLRSGWVDAMIPQLYWRDQPAAQSYSTLLEWWISSEVNTRGRHIYAGNALYRIDEQDWPISEIRNQIEISRSLSSQLSLGNVQFSFKVLQANTKGVTDMFRNELYNQPAVVPPMPWLP